MLLRSHGLRPLQCPAAPVARCHPVPSVSCSRGSGASANSRLRGLMGRTQRSHCIPWQAAAASIPGKPLLAEIYARAGFLMANSDKNEKQLEVLGLRRVGGSCPFDEACFQRSVQWMGYLGVPADDPFFTDWVEAFRAAQRGAWAFEQHYVDAYWQALETGCLTGPLRFVHYDVIKVTMEGPLQPGEERQYHRTPSSWMFLPGEGFDVPLEGIVLHSLPNDGTKYGCVEGACFRKYTKVMGAEEGKVHARSIAPHRAGAWQAVARDHGGVIPPDVAEELDDLEASHTFIGPPGAIRVISPMTMEGGKANKRREPCRAEYKDGVDIAVINATSCRAHKGVPCVAWHPGWGRPSPLLEVEDGVCCALELLSMMLLPPWAYQQQDQEEQQEDRGAGRQCTRRQAARALVLGKGCLALATAVGLSTVAAVDWCSKTAASTAAVGGDEFALYTSAVAQVAAAEAELGRAQAAAGQGTSSQNRPPGHTLDEYSPQQQLLCDYVSAAYQWRYKARRAVPVAAVAASAAAVRGGVEGAQEAAAGATVSAAPLQLPASAAAVADAIAAATAAATAVAAARKRTAAARQRAADAAAAPVAPAAAAAAGRGGGATAAPAAADVAGLRPPTAAAAAAAAAAAVVVAEQAHLDFVGATCQQHTNYRRMPDNSEIGYWPLDYQHYFRQVKNAEIRLHRARKAAEKAAVAAAATAAAAGGGGGAHGMPAGSTAPVAGAVAADAAGEGRRGAQQLRTGQAAAGCAAVADEPGGRNGGPMQRSQRLLSARLQPPPPTPAEQLAVAADLPATSPVPPAASLAPMQISGQSWAAAPEQLHQYQEAPRCGPPASETDPMLAGTPCSKRPRTLSAAEAAVEFAARNAAYIAAEIAARMASQIMAEFENAPAPASPIVVGTSPATAAASGPSGARIAAEAAGPAPATAAVGVVSAEVPVWGAGGKRSTSNLACAMSEC